MKKPLIAIIVAGGRGERMNADVPKQFIEIQSKPILMHTLEAFYRYNKTIQLVVVLPEAQLEFWTNLCQKHRFELKHQVVTGGQTRFQSVKNGLAVVKVPSFVAVHDGVRPLVHLQTIARCFEAVIEWDAVVPVVDSVDSIRQLTNNGSQSVDRNIFKLVQTPQVFDAELLKKAYQQEFSPVFTDDASVVEAMGISVKLVEGNRENIKITTAFDLKMADVLLEN